MRPDDKRKLSSRLNALKSTGPKTEKGKQSAANNARTHGAYAKTLVLPGEKIEDYHRLVDAHFNQWKPTSPIEENLVAQMATTMWRLSRQAPAEASLIQIQLQRMSAATYAEFEDIEPAGLYALAISNLHSFGDGPAQIARQERRLLKQYQQLREELMITRELFPPTSPDPLNPNPEQETENEGNENVPVETDLTNEDSPRAHIPMLAAENRVHNPNHHLYATLPPLPKSPATESQAATNETSETRVCLFWDDGPAVGWVKA